VADLCLLRLGTARPLSGRGSDPEPLSIIFSRSALSYHSMVEPYYHGTMGSFPHSSKSALAQFESEQALFEYGSAFRLLL
jgi:hypothetical protein